MNTEFNLFYTVSLTALFLILTGALLAYLFKHATKDKAYVRTGYGGERVIQNTGAFILPILHQAVQVNLKTINLEIDLSDESSVLTQDYMKANLSINFYVRVLPEKESISQVARTLGDLTLHPEKLKDFLSGQLIHSIRKISAEMTLSEIHKKPDFFAEKIQQLATDQLARHSLYVDLVTLKHFTQSAKEFYSEDNAFDTEGLSGLTKIIQAEKQIRHETELKAQLQARQKDLEMEKLVIDMENKKNQLRLEQQRELKIFESANALTVSQDAIKKNAEEAQAKIIAEQELEIFKHQSEIKLAEKLREKLKQQIETDLVKAEAVKAEVQVKLTKKLEKADNLVKIKLLKEKIQTEYETVNVVESAVARKSAASEDAKALKIKAEAEAERLKIIDMSRLESEKLIESSLINRYQNEAEGLKVLIDAFNALPKSDLPKGIYPELVKLFSKLCIENNQSINKFSIPETQIDKSFEVEKPQKYKNNSSEQSKTKLQVILDDARTSLTKEAIETIHDSNLNGVNKTKGGISALL